MAAPKVALGCSGRKGDLKGGPARAKTLGSKKRKEIAKQAALVRWKSR